MLISQAKNNIFQLYQSPNPTTHYVLVTDAIELLQWVILHPPVLHKSYIKNSLLQMLISQYRDLTMSDFKPTWVT